MAMKLAFAALAPVLCYSEEQPAPDETETNARLLERWRNDPEHYDRLQADLRARMDSAIPADTERDELGDVPDESDGSLETSQLAGVFTRENASLITHRAVA